MYLYLEFKMLLVLVLVLRHKVLEYYQVHSSLVSLWGSLHTLLQMSNATNVGSQMDQLAVLPWRAPLLGAWKGVFLYDPHTPSLRYITEFSH